MKLMNPIIISHLVLIIGWSPPRMTVPSPLRRDVVISSQSEQDDAQEHPLISVMEGVTRSIETRVNTVGPSESVVISLRVTKVSG
jgi:hypothetical protein